MNSLISEPQLQPINSFNLVQLTSQLHPQLDSNLSSYNIPNNTNMTTTAPTNISQTLMDLLNQKDYTSKVVTPYVEEESNNGGRKSRKRQRTSNEDGNSKFPPQISLPRDILLTISSEELENYIKQLKAGRTLNKEEERELKRQRRLIKNREYAHNARAEKNQFVTSLKQKADNLAKQNSDLQAEVMILNNKIATVTTENTQLRLQLAHLQARLAHNKIGTLGSLGPTRSVAAGACLLAILFFGLFFSFTSQGLFRPDDKVTESFTTTRILLETDINNKLDTPGQLARKDVNRLREDGGTDANVKCDYNQVCYLYQPKPELVEEVKRDPHEMDTSKFTAENATAAASAPSPTAEAR